MDKAYLRDENPPPNNAETGFGIVLALVILAVLAVFAALMIVARFAW